MDFILLLLVAVEAVAIMAVAVAVATIVVKERMAEAEAEAALLFTLQQEQRVLLVFSPEMVKSLLHTLLEVSTLALQTQVLTVQVKPFN